MLHLLAGISAFIASLAFLLRTMAGSRAQWSWSVSDLPKRGDWLQSRGRNSRIVCKEYDAPPPNGKLIDNGILPKSHVFGPVHEIRFISDDENEFVCVSVPSYYRPGTLAWVNIENKGTRFAALDRKWAGFLD